MDDELVDPPSPGPLAPMRLNSANEDEVAAVRGGRQNLEFDFRLHSFVRRPNFERPSVVDTAEYKPRRKLTVRKDIVGAHNTQQLEHHNEYQGLVRESRDNHVLELRQNDISFCCISRKYAVDLVANLRRDRRHQSRSWEVAINILDKVFQYSFWFRDTILFESVWLFLAMLGTFSAILAWIIDEISAAALATKLNVADAQGSAIIGLLVWGIFSVCSTIGAVVCVRYISPVAAGSGIPEMKSVLSGFHIQGYLSVRTLVAKVLGLMFALSSGLVIGKEGPLVHISSIICFQLRKLEVFKDIHDSKILTRQALAAACAVGVSSTFGAPIGGVLFSIETTSTFYHTQDYWKGFFCAVCAAMVFKQLSNIGYSRDKLVSLFTTNFDPLPYSLYEVPMYITLSLGCGIAAGFFVLMHKHVYRFKQRNRSRWIFSKPGVYAVLVTVLSSLLQYPFGSFLHLSTHRAIDDLFIEQSLSDNNTHFDDWDRPSIYLNLPAFAFVKYVLAVLALTIEVPSGCFSPVFAVGASLGRLFGEFAHLVGGTGVTAGGYAVVGAASFTAGVTGAVSTAVIVFELTNQLSYMLPVLLSVLIGRASARIVNYDLYHELAKERRLPSHPTLSHERNYLVHVQDVMEPQVVCVPRFATQSEVDMAVARIPPSSISDPLYEIAIVDSLANKLYIGSMRGHILAAISVMDVWSNPGDIADATGAPSVSPATFSSPFSSSVAGNAMSPETLAISSPTSQLFNKVDLTTLCNVDDSTLAISESTYVPDALLLFHAHSIPSMFVVNQRRVVGRLVLEDLKQYCDSGVL